MRRSDDPIRTSLVCTVPAGRRSCVPPQRGPCKKAQRPRRAAALLEVERFLHLVDRLVVEVLVDDDASGVLAGDDGLSLPDLDLSLRRDRKAGGGASLERHDGPAVAEAIAEFRVGLEVAAVHLLGRLVSELLEGFLLVLRIVDHLFELVLLLVEHRLEFVEAFLRLLDGPLVRLDGLLGLLDGLFGLGDALLLAFNLLRERVELAVVADFELLLLVLVNEASASLMSSSACRLATFCS